MSKILIIEDEKALNDLIAMNIKLMGHDVVQMYNSSELFNVVHKSNIDLAILDVMLPEKSGFEIISELHQHSQLRNIKALLR